MKTLQRFASFTARLVRDDRGAEGLEKLLIIGAIVLPLLALLILFRDSITEWVRSNWGTVKSDADNIDTSPLP
ncbi:MAG: hypothetical protein GC164_10715 [Phycisphaera sp.]|nr:hypothetical protein [Phycisphaera sp.]